MKGSAVKSALRIAFLRWVGTVHGRRRGYDRRPANYLRPPFPLRWLPAGGRRAWYHCLRRLQLLDEPHKLLAA